jgi:atypical dual specificity phosphatase
LGTGGLFLRKLRAKIADEPTGFVWVEEGRLAGSGYPASRAQVEWLVKAGVGSILTLTEQPLPAEWLNGMDVVVYHVPMKDHEVPGVESMERAVEFIEDRIDKGSAVLVHCLAGQGRTGCVLSAYLIRTRRIGAEEAMDALRKLKPEFVESRQEKSVFEFAAKYGIG